MSNKILVWDSGPIITLALNNLLWLLPELKKAYGGKFYMPAAVKREIIDRPLTTKKFKLEALQIMPYLKDGTFELIDDAQTKETTLKLLECMNSIYEAKGRKIKIVHEGEIDAISCIMRYNAEALVVDERNTRYLIETPSNLKNRLERRLRTRIQVDREQLAKTAKMLKGMKTLRSVELLTIAYELGLVDTYLNDSVEQPKQTLLEGLLWGAKLNGCAVTPEEINGIMKIERSR